MRCYVALVNSSTHVIMVQSRADIGPMLAASGQYRTDYGTYGNVISNSVELIASMILLAAKAMGLDGSRVWTIAMRYMVRPRCWLMRSWMGMAGWRWMRVMMRSRSLRLTGREIRFRHRLKPAEIFVDKQNHDIGWIFIWKKKWNPSIGT